MKTLFVLGLVLFNLSATMNVYADDDNDKMPNGYCQSSQGKYDSRCQECWQTGGNCK